MKLKDIHTKQILLRYILCLQVFEPSILNTLEILCDKKDNLKTSFSLICNPSPLDIFRDESRSLTLTTMLNDAT